MDEKPASLVHHFLERSAQKYPDKIALIHENIRVSYGEINSLANKFARLLSDIGVKQGDRVVMMMDNCLEYIVSYYAILKTGAIVIPFSNDLKPGSITNLVNELRATVIISSTKFEKVLKASHLNQFSIQALIISNPKLDWESLPFPMISWQEAIKQKKQTNLNIRMDNSALASIIYTSGSTGTPKGVMLSHKNITANTSSICQSLNLTCEDIQMVVLPFFYVMGKSLLNTLFAVAGTVVINNKFAFPATVINQMIKEKVTMFSGVPSTYAYLLHRSPLKAAKDKLTSLRCCTQAGGHMPASVKRQLIQVLPDHTDICIMYGATEASARLTYLEPTHLKNKIDSIGKPIPGVEIKILDESGVSLSAGHTGELVASGENIMQGYWNSAETTAKILDRHGYHTGDQGYMDEDGFYFVNGRKDSLIKVGGHRITPQEIEDAIIATDFVIEALVIGVDDAMLGKKLVALVTPKDNEIDSNKIMARCAEFLPKYKLPSEIQCVKMLKKNANGKIDKNKCAELIRTSGNST